MYIYIYIYTYIYILLTNYLLVLSILQETKNQGMHNVRVYRYATQKHLLEIPSTMLGNAIYVTVFCFTSFSYYFPCVRILGINLLSHFSPCSPSQ